MPALRRSRCGECKVAAESGVVLPDPVHFFFAAKALIIAHVRQTRCHQEGGSSLGILAAILEN